MVYYGKFGYTDAYKMPVNLRRYFLNQIINEVKRQNGKTPQEDMDRQLSDQDKKFLQARTNLANPNRLPQKAATTESRTVPRSNDPANNYRTIKF